MQPSPALKAWLLRHPQWFNRLRGWWVLYNDLAASIHALLFNGGIMRRHFAEQTERKLHLGCGPNRLPGWLNTDYHPAHRSVFRCDATKPLPFSDGSFTLVFTEHMIEHIPFTDGQNLLRECFRILAPGGRIRISTPDLDRVFALKRPATELERAYLADQLARIPETIDAQPSFFINQMMRAWGHTFLYDRETMQAALQVAGFRDIRMSPPGRSDDPRFDGLDVHGAIYPDPRFNEVESMVIEATR